MNGYQVVGYAGAFIGIAFALVQLRHTVRTRSVKGVSKLAWALQCCDTALWLSYGLVTSSAQQVLGNSVWLVLAFVTAWFFVKSRELKPVTGAGVPLVSLAVALPLLYQNPGWCGPIGLCFAMSQAPAQLVRSVRADDLSGVSSTAWLFGCFSGLCWVVFGIGTHDVPVITTAVPRVALSVAITAVVVVRKRSMRQAAQAGAASAAPRRTRSAGDKPSVL
jgi:MtN3 and saliva related transmembrane protein